MIFAVQKKGAPRPKTVAEYIAALPDDRRQTIETVRRVILDNLPPGYEEAILSGMISYQVPLARFSNTYNGHPLMLAGLASEKNYLAVHLMPLYGNQKMADRFRARFKAAGKKLDMGKACVRFKKADDLPLDAVAEVIAGVSLDTWLGWYEASRKKKA